MGHFLWQNGDVQPGTTFLLYMFHSFYDAGRIHKEVPIMFLLDVILFILKLIAKIALLPFFLLFFMINLVVNLLYSIGAMGYVLFACILTCGIVTSIMDQNWNGLICFGMISLIGTGAFFAGTFLLAGMEVLLDGMLEFMFS